MRGASAVLRPIHYLFALACASLIAAVPADAHHSIAGQFDMTRTLNMKGVVKRVDWVNPHVYMYLETKDETGTPVLWKLETLPVAMLRKAGIKKQMLVTGDVVDVAVSPARDGTAHLGFLLNIRFPDGKRFQFSRDPNAPAATQS